MSEETRERRHISVHGTVTDAAGKPVEGAEVALFRQRLRTRDRMANGTSTDDGRYRLEFTLPDDAPGQLLVVAEARSERLVAPIESMPTPVSADTVINLAEPLNDPSLYGALLRTSTLLLNGLSLLDVVENGDHQDISFLANATGRSKEQIMQLAVASRLEHAFSVPAAAWYAFLSARVPASLPASLLDAAQNFSLIDALVSRVGALIAGLDAAQQTSTLANALQQNVVGSDIGKQIPDLVTHLQALRTANLLNNPYLAGKTSLAQLLGAAGLAADKQTAFAQALAANTQPLGKFWAALADGQHGFTADEVASIRQTLSIGAFVKNALPLISAVQQRFSAGTYKAMPDLAKLSEQDWLDLINAAGAGAVPGNIAGADPAGTFAKEIYNRVTAAYPTAALSARAVNFVPAAQQAPLTAFFTNNATLDLRRQNLNAYLTTAGAAAFAGIAPADEAAVKANLGAMQRVLRIVPHVDICETLLSIGLGAAASISMLGKQQFVTKLVAAGVAAIDAYKTYALARTRYAATLSLYTRFNNGVVGLWPQAFGPQAPYYKIVNDAVAADASLAVLFGSQDYCVVDDCTSILSPAAYLTDLLLWLSRRTVGVTGFANALAVLNARRPDLGNLLLNCPNTDTALPYIDVVNELLADKITPPVPAAWRQTTLSAAILRAAPDPANANPAADALLLQGVYPRALPYDAALDLLSSVLAQSNVALWQLRQAFLPLHGMPTTAEMAPIASARFSISAAERALITTAASAASLPQVWNTANPLADLARVNVFLAAANLTYEQLLELLDVAWVRHGGAVTTIQGLDDTCNTSTQTLAPLDTGRLDLMHRFLRLWARTGWKMWELDLLLSAPAIGDPALAPQTLNNLFTIRLLLNAAGLSVDQLLAFFQDIDLVSHRDPDGTATTPLYATLFLNPASPQDPALNPYATPSTLDGTADLATHAPAIQAAFQISATDAATLLALTDNHRTLDNLSFIYRIVLLARSLRFAISDLLTIASPSVSGVFATPAATLAFVQRAGKISASGFSVDQLTYVLSTAPAKSGITDAQVTSDIVDVTAAMQKVQQSVYGSGDPPYTVLGKQFAQLPPSTNPANPSLADPGQAKIALGIVDGSYSPTGTDPTANAFINAQFVFFMTPAELANAVATLTALAPLPTTATSAAIAARAALVATRANLVLAPLARYLTQTQVVAAVASDLALAADTIAYLMNTLIVPQVPASTETLLAALTDPGLLAASVPPTVLTAASNAIRLIYKIGVVISQLHLVKADLTWMVPNAAVYAGLDLANLPVVPGQAAQSIDQLLATVLLVQLNRSFVALSNSTLSPPPPITSLFTLIGAVHGGTIASDTAAQAAFAGIAGVLATDVAALSGAIGLSLAAGDWKSPAAYSRLRTLLAMAAAAGGSGLALASWGIEVPDETAAAGSALSSLKSRYTNDAWLAPAQALNDPLRQNRRDALVAYLTGQRNTASTPWAPMPWGTDSDSLFDWFLIDTGMSSCMDTSRVVQAYQTVQLFVERCLMNLEANVDTSQDDTWQEWDWMKRYRLWQANREIFLWPENWLVEANRPNNSELFVQLMQATRQTNATADALETVVLDYIQGLDDIAHLRVVGMCQDPVTDTVHVIARTHSDPPVYYHRTLASGAWSPWVKIALNIKAHQVVPVVHRRSLFLFWAEVSLANEPQQTLPPAQASSSSSKSGPPARHAEIRIASSAWRNNQWTPTAYAGGTLYDAPLLLLEPNANATQRMVEALYTIKVNLPTSSSRTDLWIDVFRYLDYTGLVGFLGFIVGLGGGSAQENEFDLNVGPLDALVANPRSLASDTALHVGRAVFDGRFDALELRNTRAILQGLLINDYLVYAQAHYGHDAERLTELTGPDSPLIGDSSLLPKAGALVTSPIGSGATTAIPLYFSTTVSAQEQNVGPLLQSAQAPYAVIGPATDLQFDPANDFVYTDPKRAYYVQATRYYEYGSQWRPVVPSNPADVPYQIRYSFQRFYHPYTDLFWHEIFNAGLPALYSPTLQASPATVDPSQGDNFSFQTTYNPVVGFVNWGEDGEIIDFSRSAAYSVYNWELFFHVPLYVGQALRHNQQFEDALSWLEYIFNPTAAGPAPVPQRYWVTLPFSTTAATAQQQISDLLKLVNQDDPAALFEVQTWEKNPFNPFLVADQRPVAYMKAVVMAYVDTLTGWADNLFATASRENLGQATLLLVRASEIMGPLPQAVPPPPRADASFNTLRPDLDAFANAMVAIENVLPAGSGSGGGDGGPLPAPETFYFKIPPNDQLLARWNTIADRLYKLRHCLSITGQPLALPLFDAPLDPGLLAAAEAAGVDLSSVLNDISAPLPNYRYDVLYAQAQNFCTAVRTFGTQLLAALEKKDADALALLLPTLQQQLLVQQNQIYQWQVDAANAKLSAFGQAIAVQTTRNQFYTQHATAFVNASEQTSIDLQNDMITAYGISAAVAGLAVLAYIFPDFSGGAAGFGGPPPGQGAVGGTKSGDATAATVALLHDLGQIIDRQSKLSKQQGDYQQRADHWNEQAAESTIETQRLTFEQTAASIAVQIAQQQQTDHQTAIDNLQQQIDFLTNKFTNEQLYDWLSGTLSTVYFQSYRMAYAMAKRAERDYQYELALPNASFIQFGYWDSLYQGLLAGEQLMADLLRMHASYLDLNVRRYEISRIISLARLAPISGTVPPLIQLLQTGACDFALPETLFDADYPGHYQRQLRRVSITLVYANPGKNDNVTCTLTLVSNQVRMNTTLNTGGGDPYAETPVGQDPRFAYQYGAVQTIVSSQAQDDPGLFENQIHYQITDPRYLPFEGAGAISDWHLELPSTNEIDVSSASDVLVHVLYTALDGGPDFKQAAITSLASSPQYTTKLFSAANDFSAPAATAANPYPLTPWQSFLATPPSGTDQVLTLSISAAKFPAWTRGRTITITGITAYAVSWSGAWTGASFVLEPQPPAAINPDFTLTPMAGTPALLAAGAITPLPASLTKPGTWTFKLRLSTSADFRSLTASQIGDLVLQLQFTAT